MYVCVFIYIYMHAHTKLLNTELQYRMLLHLQRITSVEVPDNHTLEFSSAHMCSLHSHKRHLGFNQQCLHHINTTQKLEKIRVSVIYNFLQVLSIYIQMYCSESTAEAINELVHSFKLGR